jgi:hypothetical protein
LSPVWGNQSLVSRFLLFSSFLDIEKLKLIMPNNNTIMMYHYIATNIPQMDPPIIIPMLESSRLDIPNARVFVDDATDNDNIFFGKLETAVKRFLEDHSIKIISCCNEDAMGVFIEFDDLKNLIDFYHELKKQKMLVPLADSVESVKVEVEVNYLPPPSCCF